MKIKPIGIDLGTTFSVTATINSNGNPEIILNDEGERITPSVVYFESESSLVVGTSALEQIVTNPANVVRCIKREMGNNEYFFEAFGRKHSAVDISSYILKKLINDVSKFHPGSDVKQVVITVPAYFDEIRRKATMDAAKKAGLTVLRIINEPTAAALAYANQGHITGKTLIYDFGGGTFDVSVVDIKSQTEINVLSSEGDHQLGGYDIDLLIANYFAKKYSENFMSDKIVGARVNTISGCEHVKKVLSKTVKASKKLDSGTEQLLCELTRETLEDLIKELITRTEMLIESAIIQAALSFESIDNVILVGGSTRIPAVKKMLQTKFNKEPISSLSPDEAVALGAAIQAGLLVANKGNADLTPTAIKSLNRTKLSDVTAHSFGTLIVDEFTKTLRNDILIPKNTPLPASCTKEYYTNVDNQTSLECNITQGEDEDPTYVNLIKKELMTLPNGRRKGSPVHVTYIYDANGRMSCNFLDVGSGVAKVVSLDFNRKEEASNFNDTDFDDFEIK